MRLTSQAVGASSPSSGGPDGSAPSGSSSRAGSPRRQPARKKTEAAASSSTSYGRPRTNSMLKVDPALANASGSAPYDDHSFSSATVSSSSTGTNSHPFARHPQQRAGNETPSFALIDSFSGGGQPAYSPEDEHGPGDMGGSAYGLGLGMPAAYADDARRVPTSETGARWADIDDGVRTGRSPSWTNTFVGEMQSKKKVWLKAPKGGNRRVSDGLLSPATTSPPRSHRLPPSAGTLYRRRLQLALGRLPLLAKLSPSSREFVVVLLGLCGLLYVLHIASPAFEPFLSSSDSSSHHSAFISSHLGEGRVQPPLDPPPDPALTRYPNPRMLQQPAAVPLSPKRPGDKWVWKDKREELGSLVQYIASSDMHSLPVVDEKKPLDPQLVLDFNPYSSRGPKLVSQMVDDFWTGNGEGASGQVLIIGRGRDPSVFTIRALIESLGLEPPIMFLDLENRPDSYHLSAILLRIMDVPRFPVLVLGGHVVGDFFAVRKAQLDHTFEQLLVDANVGYAPTAVASVVPHRGVPEHVYADVAPPPAPILAPALAPPTKMHLAGAPLDGSELDGDEYADYEDEEEEEGEEEEEDYYEWDEEDEDDPASALASAGDDDQDDGPSLGIGMKIGFDEDDYLD